MLKMKSCPRCERTYSDLSLSYCLQDGSVLSAPYDSDEYQYSGSEGSESYRRTVEMEVEMATVVANRRSVPSLDVSLEGNSVRFGDNFTVSFQRTLRIPDDGKTYPLPPGLGEFPICRVADYEATVPETWIGHGGIFIPMYQREALWLDFEAANWRPNAIKIAAGKINAVTGEPWSQQLSSNNQDYMVCPPQEWLDGFKTGSGIVRQFVAMPLGRGYTVEEQLSGADDFGGLQIIVFDPKPGIFPDVEPEGPLRCIPHSPNEMGVLAMKSKQEKEMGLAAGGKIEQKIYPDKYGADTWDETKYGRLFVHIVNSKMFEAITGLEAPSTPISAETYSEYGFPWFQVYDEHLNDVSVAEDLYSVKPIGLMDKIKGVFTKTEVLSIKDEQIKKIKSKTNKIDDGTW